MDCAHCSAYVVKDQPYPRHCYWHAEEPASCGFFARGEPYVAAPARAGQPACYSCEFVRFNLPETARCLARFPLGKGQAREDCELYLPRRWGHLDCPGCHTSLSVVSSELIACETGHSFYLSRGHKIVCTGCGAELQPYVYRCEEGAVDSWYKVTIHYCLCCGWGNFQTRYAGPSGARGRGFGGQRWSPRTGRRLTY